MMKKVILSLFVVGALLATSCKNTKEDAKDAANDAIEAVDNAAEETKEAVQNAAEETKEAAQDMANSVESAIEGITIPEFEDPKVGEYLQSYTEHAKDYIEAKGDVVKNSELVKESAKLAEEAKEILANLDEEATKKFNSTMAAIQAKMAPAN
ncbi:hypothetical protein P8625_07410 [Tenacibaculum tangerinum]|uniref:Lipoprotein n=1 Tax=Tenacibaculum tangerinum TaxID=3038772 RepID=A0ABY8L6D9_9FLAO|nr:hypothetical protein [Tenacibaculum tangerinum]WGH76960.1 hypothetical protein P8625_07410 [Tenacibaculum tangerinum]